MANIVRAGKNQAPNYNPDGNFSFEFRKRLRWISVPIMELFFLFPPEEYTLQEGYKVTTRRTVHGAHIDDFGNDFKKITIRGSIYCIWEGQAGLVSITGEDEFKKWRYALSRFRDISQGRQLGGLIEIPAITALKDKAEAQTRYDELEIIYHDYDDDNHYEVVLEKFQMSRTKDDPFTVKYEIAMTGIRDVSMTPFPFVEFIRRVGLMSFVTSIYLRTIEIAAVILNFTTAVKNVINTFRDIDAYMEDWQARLADFSQGFWQNIANPVSSCVDILLESPTEESVNMSDLFEVEIPEVILASRGIDPELLFDPDASMSGLEPSAYELIHLMHEITYLSRANLALPKYAKSYTPVKDDIPVDESLDLTTEEMSDFNTTGQTGNTEIPGSNVVYTVSQHDTPMSISRTIFGTSGYGQSILSANDLKNSDFENEGLVGKQIVIPTTGEGQLASETNLVYALPVTAQATVRERVISDHGIDLFFDLDGNIQADGSGDLKATYGFDCLFASLQDRLRNPKLNDLHPEWGLGTAIGDVPSSVFAQRVRRDIIAQILLDPRVKLARIEDVIVEGDTTSVRVLVTPRVGDSKMLESDIFQMVGG